VHKVVIIIIIIIKTIYLRIEKINRQKRNRNGEKLALTVTVLWISALQRLPNGSNIENVYCKQFCYFYCLPACSNKTSSCGKIKGDDAFRDMRS
jgi:hypothetical protein